MNNITKVHDILTCVFSAFGVTVSMNDINNTLNIILLVFSIINIILLLGFKIYNIVKDGKITKEEQKELIEATEEAKKELEGLKGGKDE